MHPVESRTGAIRLEDPKRGAMWLQLGNKSMLMSQKLGQRLADECQSPEQLDLCGNPEEEPAAEHPGARRLRRPASTGKSRRGPHDADAARPIRLNGEERCCKPIVTMSPNAPRSASRRCRCRAKQTAELIELLKNPPAGEEAFLLDLITHRVPAGVDDAAKVKACYLAAVAHGTEKCALISRDQGHRAAGHHAGRLQHQAADRPARRRRGRRRRRRRR